jgi:hypothetical protein
MATSSGHASVVTYVAGDWEGPLAASGLSVRELWLACLALGGNATPAELDRYLHHDMTPSRYEHNVVAQALNERLHDLGYDRPVPYQ